MDLVKNIYIPTLIKNAKQNLKKEFNLDNFPFKDFEYINAHLIYQSIEKNLNTLITIPNKKIKPSFYVPTILILALESFFKNYIDDSTNYSIGDIVENKNGKRYKISEIDEERFYILVSNDKNKSKIRTKDLSSYTITTAGLRNRKIRSFDLYRKFFNLIFSVGENKLPSKFKYKSIVVTSKEIIDELKDFEFKNQKIHKAFPFQYITKSGKRFNNIPIDPMIYIVNDYETAKEYIIDDSPIKIESVIFIGKNKYASYIPEIASDLRNKRYNNCILIGTDDINGLPNLIKWKWTDIEYNYLNSTTINNIKKIICDNADITNLIEEYHKAIKDIENRYCITLKELYYFLRKIFTIVIPHDESRLKNQIEIIRYSFNREAQEIVRNAFFDIGEFDFENTWECIREKYNSIIESVMSDKSKIIKLSQLIKIDYLVVPFEYKEVWSEDIKYLKLKVKNIITYEEFLKLKEENINENYHICFINFWGYKHLNSIISIPHHIYLLLSPYEEKLYEKCYSKYKQFVYSEIQSKDRKVLSNVQVKEKTKIEEISELIERLYKAQEIEPTRTSKALIDNENIIYEIVFEDGEVHRVDANKSVLLIKDGKEREEKVHNLIIGDEVRIYDNSTKEQLYEIALQEDKEGRFKQIEEHSRLWKMKLRNYYNNNYTSIEKMFNDLRNKGLTIKNLGTLKKWLNLSDNVKFPQNIKDLNLLRRIINDEELDNKFKEILLSRKAYNSIMIALGRDLSEEIMDYVKNGSKGKILQRFSDVQIENFVEQNAPKRKITKIRIIEDADEQ